LTILTSCGPEYSRSVRQGTPRASYQFSRWHVRLTRPVCSSTHTAQQLTVYPYRAPICQLTQLTFEELLLRSTAVPCEGGVDGLQEHYSWAPRSCVSLSYSWVFKSHISLNISPLFLLFKHNSQNQLICIVAPCGHVTSC
jgi:hypothetical protein